MIDSFSRILIKISGEKISGESGSIDKAQLEIIFHNIRYLLDAKKRVAIVVGGGNFIRGNDLKEQRIDPVSADYIGMFATCMNGVALSSYFDGCGIQNRLIFPNSSMKIGYEYNQKNAKQWFENGEVLIFAGGLGLPHFTTDTASVMRASEMGCDAIFKISKHNGVYDSDPAANSDAKHYKNISYTKVLKDELRVMDMTAFALAKERGVKIIISKLEDKSTMDNILNQKSLYTIIENDN